MKLFVTRSECQRAIAVRRGGMVNPTITERQKPGSKPINFRRGGSFHYIGVKQSYIVAYRVRVNEWLS